MTTEVKDVNAQIAALHKQQNEASAAGEWAKVAGIAGEIAKLYKGAVTAATEAKRERLAASTAVVKAVLDRAVMPIIDRKPLDDARAKALIDSINSAVGMDAMKEADGIWYARDFGDNLQTCRLMAKATKAASTGGVTQAYPKSSKDLLEAHGAEAYNPTADKEKPYAGMTMQDAWDGDTDKNHRQAVRNALIDLDSKG